jgi:methionyl-tRNA formyltransferase
LTAPIAVAATAPFGADVLERLAASREIACLLTRPDAPAGRGRRLAAPPAKKVAERLGIPVVQPERLEPGLELGAATIVAVAYGRIVPEPLLAERLWLNVHPSLLPRWRGAAPIERAMLAGDETTGVSVMRVTAGLDSGPTALTEEVEIAGRDFGELSAELARLGAELLVRALDALAAGELELTEQDDALATYAEKITPLERRLDPGRPASELERAVRALTPHIGAYLELEGGRRLGVRRASVVKGPDAEGGSAGAAVRELAAVDGSLVLSCAEGVLRLDEVQPAGKRPMAGADYLRGHDLPRLAAA